MQKEPLRIAVSGLSGCGNTTVSRLLADRLGLESINYTFRNLAGEKGITFEEMSALAEEDDQWDNYLDRHQVGIAMEGSCILASRLAIWLLVEADYKIYLSAQPNARFERIALREGETVEETSRKTLVRDRRDIERYKRLYDIDILNLRPADLVLETDHQKPEELVEVILAHLKEKQLI